MELTTKCATFFDAPRYIDPGVEITVTGRRIMVSAGGWGVLEADLPARLSDANLQDGDVRACALIMLMPIAAKFAYEFSELVDQSSVNQLAQVIMPDQAARLNRSLRGAMAAAGVRDETQSTIFDALNILEPGMFQ